MQYTKKKTIMILDLERLRDIYEHKPKTMKPKRLFVFFFSLKKCFWFNEVEQAYRKLEIC